MIWSCSQSHSSLSKSAISGYEYEVYRSGPGSKPSVDDQVYFKMDIYDDKDSLLQSYQNQKVLPSVKIVDQSNPMRKKNPVLDIASFLTVGDSVGIIVPVDSVPSMPQGYDDIKHIEYHLCVTEILSPEAFKAKVEEDQKIQLAEMERMRDLIPQVEQQTEEILDQYKAGKLDLLETTNGVKYIIHEKGNGQLPTNDRMVTMTYYGRTVADGNRFDDSYNRGRGYTFRLGRGEVIRGWDEAAPYLPVGTTASIFIPSDLGYGPTGSPPSILPNSELYFYVTVDEMYY